MPGPLYGRLAVITGTSRGVGAAIARALAGLGADILGSHVDPNRAKRQRAVEQQVRHLGGEIRSRLADITDRRDRQALLHDAREWHPGGIDYLILNAAGGLEDDKPPGWARRINTTAQLALVDEFRPFIKQGGGIVFITSIWAHRFGEARQLPHYGFVAQSKHDTEHKLRNLIPGLSKENIKLAVICSHIVQDTAAYHILNLTYPEIMTRMRVSMQNGEFLTPSQVGGAIADMLIGGFDQGHTKYIGETKVELISGISIAPLSLDSSEISRRLRMFSVRKRLVQEFRSEEDRRRGIGRYGISWRDTNGHLYGDFRSIKLMRAVDVIEAAAQVLGLTYKCYEHYDFGQLPLFGGIRPAGQGVAFNKMLFPGDTMVLRSHLTGITASKVFGDVEVRVGRESEVVAAQIPGLVLSVLPNREFAESLYAVQKALRGPSPAR